jgi:hypothetical protein
MAQEKAEGLSAAGRLIATGLLCGGALFLSAGVPASAASSAHVATHAVRRDPPAPKMHHPFAAAYGQVVASSPTAFVLQLSNGAWLAVNVVAGTSVSGPGGTRCTGYDHSPGQLGLGAVRTRLGRGRVGL